MAVPNEIAGNSRFPVSRARYRPGLARSSLTVWALLFCLTLTGCSTSKATRSQADAELLRLTGFWQPHQMYLLASPHPRLYVEVDAVEGCNPSEGTLNKLRDFLATHCRKPGGIEIVRSDVIPVRQALGALPSALARKYLNGPPESTLGTEAPPAFLYILFYDDVLSDRPSVVETGHPGAKIATRSRLRNRNPHVEMLPYPAMIYMNERWSPKSFHDDALLHEAGHILGLSFRATNASAGHCLSHPCRMTASVHLIPFLLGLDKGIKEPLCEDCLAQLATSRTQPPPANVRFVGPVLVRSEPGYYVLNLPHRVKLIVGELSEQDCRDFTTAVHAETPSQRESEDSWGTGAFVKDAMLHYPRKMHDVITRAIADPDWHVRRVAPRLWTVCAGWYSAHGQFANAVDACRQAILADPADDQSYNLLAWIKATCPDASVRDGKEAVSAARRACELTQWKQWSWIDTLAAACAEAGDFKRAVKFQEQALGRSNPTQSEQKDMRERLSLYQQSRPFRENH